MLRSGTKISACFTPCRCTLSNATNISARLFPDAGGDLISRYCSPRFSYARSCMGRMPNALFFAECPVCAYCVDMVGMATPRVGDGPDGAPGVEVDEGWICGFFALMRHLLAASAAHIPERVVLDVRYRDALCAP